MFKLMIVDDEPLIRRGIKAFVDFNGLKIDEVYEASNGEEGLKIFEVARPDLVLMDINMPKMNGLELAKAIKALKPEVKIAVITGYDYFDYAVTALKTGIDDYILKPVSRKEITEVLTRLIEKLKIDLKQVEIEKVVTKIQEDTGSKEEMGYKALIGTAIENNLANSEFSLTGLAEQLGFSVGYLSGLFKKIFGISFQDYVLYQRLERAKLLLLTTPMKNYEIAEKVGFEDPNYFSTRFRKQYGCSPRAYQQKAGE